MLPRDGVGMWRVARECGRGGLGPFSFLSLARRFAETSAVWRDADDCLRGYVLACHDGDTLRVIDFAIDDEAQNEAILWSLLEACVEHRREVATVELPATLQSQLAVDGSGLASVRPPGETALTA